MSGERKDCYTKDGHRLIHITEFDLQVLKDNAVRDYKQQMEKEMAKDEQTTSKQVNQHHRMAQGQKIELKKGGHVKKAVKKAEAKKKK